MMTLNIPLVIGIAIVFMQIFGSFFGALLTRVLLNNGAFFEAFIGLGILRDGEGLPMGSLKQHHSSDYSAVRESESVGPQILASFAPISEDPEEPLFGSRFQVFSY
jgi:hypothetical protein